MQHSDSVSNPPKNPLSSAPQPRRNKQLGLWAGAVLPQHQDKSNSCPQSLSPHPGVPRARARQAPPALRNKGRLLGCPRSTGRWLRALGHKQPTADTAEVSHKAPIVTATRQCRALGHCPRQQGAASALPIHPVLGS